MTNAGLKKRCDDAFGRKVRSRGRCEIRGLDMRMCGGILNCMHIVPRGNKRLRYDEKNALAGCEFHHDYYTNHPSEWRTFIRKNFPENDNYIQQNRNTFEKPEYAEILKRLEKYAV